MPTHSLLTVQINYPFYFILLPPFSLALFRDVQDLRAEASTGEGYVQISPPMPAHTLVRRLIWFADATRTIIQISSFKPSNLLSPARALSIALTYALSLSLSLLPRRPCTPDGSFHPDELNEKVEEISCKYILSLGDCLDKAFDDYDNKTTDDLL